MVGYVAGELGNNAISAFNKVEVEVEAKLGNICHVLAVAELFCICENCFIDFYNILFWTILYQAIIINFFIAIFFNEHKIS